MAKNNNNKNSNKQVQAKQKKDHINNLKSNYAKQKKLG
jgi:hypothetical protein